MQAAQDQNILDFYDKFSNGESVYYPPWGAPLTTRLASSYPALDFLLLANEATVKTVSNIFSII